MKQTLFIITGLPFAGKTTLAKELVKRLNFEVTSVDEMIDKHNFTVEKMSYADWGIVYDEAFEKLGELLKGGNSVIFDGGSLKKTERQNLKNVAEKSGVPWKLVYVNTTKEEIIQRRKENLKTQKRDQLEDNTMGKAFAMFEELTPDENYTIFNSHMDLDKWLEMNTVDKKTTVLNA